MITHIKAWHHPTSSPPDQTTPPCEPASEPATIRKILALVVVTPWDEIVAMMAGATALAIVAVAVVLVAGAAAVLVIPVAIPGAALALAMVGLVKMAVKPPLS